MVEFFNAKMQECGLCTASGRPVITAQIDMEKNYAFLEVCSLTSNAKLILLPILPENFTYAVMLLCRNDIPV